MCLVYKSLNKSLNKSHNKYNTVCVQIMYKGVAVNTFVTETMVLWQSLVCLWTHTDEEAGLMRLSGAVCLCLLVSGSSNRFLPFRQNDWDFVEEFCACPVLQPTENRICLSPTSTLWMSLKFRDTRQWGETKQQLVCQISSFWFSSVILCHCLCFQSRSAGPPGHSKPSLPGPSYLLWSHLPRLLLPEQAAGHLLQGKPDPRVWRSAENRLEPRVRWTESSTLYTL